MAMDTGEVASLQDAMQLFSTYQLGVEVGPEVLSSPTLQAALLTLVNCARRCFLGGVFVDGDMDAPLCVPWTSCRTIGEAVRDLQGHCTSPLSPTIPRVVLGSARSTISSAFAVRATFDGWNAGVTPLDGGPRLAEQQEFVPAGVFAGALAVSEAFQFVRGRNAEVGRREVGLSLWRPEASVAWSPPTESGPAVEKLPSRLWLIGLGHLGQAYLWTLGLLPYTSPNDVELVLQDCETLVEANDSTSLLTSLGVVGRKKTRAMAEWCEARGFQARIIERQFAENFKLDVTRDPRVALCGVDNAPTRAALEGVGFARIIEAGLGGGTEEFLDFQLHSFPASRRASQVWKRTDEAPRTDSLMKRPAYGALAADGIDDCGLTLLAGRAIGAPFVGAAVSALVIAEILRMTLGDRQYELIDGSLRSIQHRVAIPAGQRQPFNPASTPAVIRK